MLRRKCINWYVDSKHKVVFYEGWVIEEYVAIHYQPFYKEIMIKRQNPIIKTSGFIPEGCIMSESIEGKAEEIFEIIYHDDEVRCDIGYLNINGIRYAVKEKIFKRLKSWINVKSNIKVRFMVKEYKGEGGTTYCPYLLVEDETGNEKISICGLLERVFVK